MIAVFITVENGLDVEVKLGNLTLDIETATGRLNCRFVAFQRVQSIEFVQQVGDVAVPARDAIKGWAHFQYKDGIRIADFQRLLFTAQAIGEPEQTYRFEPYDWDDARKSNSQIVMLPIDDS